LKDERKQFFLNDDTVLRKRRYYETGVSLMSVDNGQSVRGFFDTISLCRRNWYLIGPSFLVAILFYIHFSFGLLPVWRGVLTFPDVVFVAAAIALLVAFSLSFVRVLPGHLGLLAFAGGGGGGCGLGGFKFGVLPPLTIAPHVI
jgi:hypothetical protein